MKLPPINGLLKAKGRCVPKAHLRLWIVLLCLGVWGCEACFSQTQLQRVGLVVEGGDTLYVVRLHDVVVYPPIRFKNKKQEKFYWKTVRDVKKTLPYAKIFVKEMEYADGELAKLHTKKERKQWWKAFEKYLFKKYEKDLRGMTASQGMMLMKLIDRECDKTGYELIKQYKGKASANFWQFVAKLFKNDLKEGYDGKDKDKIVERVITLVEAGQL